MVLDLFIAGIAIILVALVTNISGSGSTGYLGVALYQIVTFSTSLQTLVTEWTQIEMALGAISRDMSATNGPQKGAIVFNGFTVSYDTSTDPVLKNINLSITPGENVAICGRTGSGKSSLVSTLLRMLELQLGSICVDDIDISTITRQAVRARFNSLPQDPFFLQGTVRENLDPLRVSTDERLVQALQSVRLWDFCESRGGLDEDMNEGTLSHGQRQLFCLVRAVINPSSVLIIDEVGGSVEADTETLIHEVLQKEFEACTVIVVVHKLHTTLDLDRFVVPNKGRIVEAHRVSCLNGQDHCSRRYMTACRQTRGSSRIEAPPPRLGDPKGPTLRAIWHWHAH
ncbi:AAA+ ATPase domain [Penicillium roqueforti FM164]|uniref:AAA+ ATPase domain n=1 Tax=Penicillium roqueforti (strain FM164) TaxID=1365484 RepID=W6Q2Q4_PENRF|nr:AAA+ ATPase domain [Penicillium roqueforti FM164]